MFRNYPLTVSTVALISSLMCSFNWVTMQGLLVGFQVSPDKVVRHRGVRRPSCPGIVTATKNDTSMEHGFPTIH
jgi:hypothetical protein